MRVLKFIAALLMLFASPAIARDINHLWTVTQKTGDVRVHKAGKQPASVQMRTTLSPGDIVSTGPNGRAMLTNGNNYVVVAPSSQLMLPSDDQRSNFTRLIQQVGTMLYKVQRRGSQHFSVDTPMLAAVVKGTTFTIVVDERRTAVQVTEGTVEVNSLTGSARNLVQGGKMVYVDRDRPDSIIEANPATDLPQTASSETSVRVAGSGNVSLGTIAELTNGLLRELPAILGAPASGITARITGAAVTGTTATPATVTGTVSNAANASIATGTGTTAAAVVGVTQVTGDVVTVVANTSPAVVATVVQPVMNIAEATPTVVATPVVEGVTVIPPLPSTIVDAAPPVSVVPVIPTVPVVPTIPCVVGCPG